MFAAFSTLDFVAHLDRQVHDLHCSFVPGVVAAGHGSEGCQVTLLSPYSSLFRTWIWGGLPISLPAMAVFAVLGWRGLHVFFAQTEGEGRRAAAILLAIAGIPLLASVVMATIAFTQLHAACKLCIGIYASSVVAFVAAFLAWWNLRHAEPQGNAARDWLVAAGQVAGFVVAPLLLYVMLAPDFSRFVAGCGTLKQPSDPYNVMVSLSPEKGGVATIEVLDPLCPSCRGLEDRLAASSVAAHLQRKAVLFPLDSECNWMITDSLHPGACAVSEAVLCAEQAQGGDALSVVRWAFENQEDIVRAAKQDPKSAVVRVREQFPALKSCLGSSQVRARLNKSLRWAVANELAVITPQVFVAGHAVCPEDTDLGLDWTLHQLLQRHRQGKLPEVVPQAAEAPEPAEPEAVRKAPRPSKPAKPSKAQEATPTPAAEPADEPAPAELPSVGDEPTEEVP